MKRPIVIVGAFIIGVLALFFYFQQLPPADVEPMGEVESVDESETVTVAWLSLAVAVVSLLTAVVGLVQKFIEMRQTARQ